MKKKYITPRVSEAQVEYTQMLAGSDQPRIQNGRPADGSDALVNGYDDEYTDIWGNTYN